MKNFQAGDRVEIIDSASPLLGWVGTVTNVQISTISKRIWVYVSIDGADEKLEMLDAKQLQLHSDLLAPGTILRTLHPHAGIRIFRVLTNGDIEEGEAR